MLEVTRTYLPSKARFLEYIDSIWDSHQLTNNGPFLRKLEDRLKEYSGSPSVLACTNGTIVIQLALKAMKVTGEVITTPFSYVATTNALLWEGCKPVFVDVKASDLTIDANKIEAAITEHTQAILATHVYGNPCDVEAIARIADKYKLKIIYDAANSFGTRYKGKSVFQFGDISTCSFHATKLFHSVEGGALFVNDEAYTAQLSLYRAFGHINDDYYSEGINAKMSELHAAMGLCVLDDIEVIIKRRKDVSAQYDRYLQPGRSLLSIAADLDYNFAYYPIAMRDEATLLACMKALEEIAVRPRRYFYPSLNTLPFLESSTSCPVSEDFASRVICLPLSHYITEAEVEKIASVINKIN